jgi:hypothetical protein
VVTAEQLALSSTATVSVEQTSALAQSPTRCIGTAARRFQLATATARQCGLAPAIRNTAKGIRPSFAALSSSSTDMDQSDDAEQDVHMQEVPVTAPVPPALEQEVTVVTARQLPSAATVSVEQTSAPPQSSTRFVGTAVASFSSTPTDAKATRVPRAMTVDSMEHSKLDELLKQYMSEHEDKSVHSCLLGIECDECATHSAALLSMTSQELHHAGGHAGSRRALAAATRDNIKVSHPRVFHPKDCASCALGTLTRSRAFKKKRASDPTKANGCHMDFSGKKVQSRDGFQYALNITDTKSGRTLSYFVKQVNGEESARCLRRFRAEMFGTAQPPEGYTVHIDPDPAFLSETVKQQLAKYNWRTIPCPADEHAFHGIAERSIGISASGTRTLLVDGSVELRDWPYCWNQKCQIENCLPRADGSPSPNSLCGIDSSISIFRRMGCLAAYRVSGPKGEDFSPWASLGKYMGLCRNSTYGTHMIRCLKSNRMHRVRSAVFFQDIVPKLTDDYQDLEDRIKQRGWSANELPLEESTVIESPLATPFQDELPLVEPTDTASPLPESKIGPAPCSSDSDSNSGSDSDSESASSCSESSDDEEDRDNGSGSGAAHAEASSRVSLCSSLGNCEQQDHQARAHQVGAQEEEASAQARRQGVQQADAGPHSLLCRVHGHGD